MPALRDEGRDGYDDVERKEPYATVEFVEMFPTPTSGNGRVRPNNINTGAAQGKASFIRKAYCKSCGFPVDLNRNDHSGGSLNGLGAGGAITTAVATITYPNGTTHTEPYGTQVYSQGGGCPHCFSKNSSQELVDPAIAVDPYSRLSPYGL